MSKRKRYPTDLTDTQWVRIEPHLPRRTSPRSRKRIHSPREILNAILYALRTGCPWRMLPHDFPPPPAQEWHVGAAECSAGQGATRGAGAGG